MALYQIGCGGGILSLNSPQRSRTFDQRLDLHMSRENRDHSLPAWEQVLWKQTDWLLSHPQSAGCGCGSCWPWPQFPQPSLLPLFSHQVVSDSSRPHGRQHASLPCPSPSPGVCPSSCPLNPWCHPTISSSVIPFSSCLQSLPASGSFPICWLFASSGLSIGASASVFPKNIQGWFPLRLTGLISLPSKGFSRVFSRRQGWDDFREKHWNIYIIMWNRSPVQVRCMNQGAQGRYSGMTLRDGRGGGSGWWTHVPPWLFHVNVWRKPLHYCKVISLQLKFKKKSSTPQFRSISSSALSFLYSPTLTSVHDYWKDHSFDHGPLSAK